MRHEVGLDYDLFDEKLPDYEATLESLMDEAGVDIGDYNSMMKLKFNKEAFTGPKAPENPSFIASESDKESTLIIDDTLFVSMFFSDASVINNFIRQLALLPKDHTLNIIINLSISDIDITIIDTGTFILNSIKNLPCKKIFNFGAQASMVTLFLAQCCDDIFIGEFAAVSITKADSGARISKYVIPVYKHLVKSTYTYWMEKGLFTQEEVDNLFAAEADNSILLLSDEIKSRMNK